MPWSTVVLDEAQAVKNAAHARGQGGAALPAAQTLALTGTPVENRLGELLVDPRRGRARACSGNAHAVPPARAPSRSSASTTSTSRPGSGASPARSCCDAPRPTSRSCPTCPTRSSRSPGRRSPAEQAAMYQAVVDQLLADARARPSGMQRRGLVLAALTRLKQICNHPAHALGDGSRLAGRSGKLARVRRVGHRPARRRRARPGVHPVPRDGPAAAASPRRAVRAARCRSSTAACRRRDRDQMVRPLPGRRARPPLLLVSLKAGGTGLNLTAASHVVHYDRWWNPAVEDQATDRAWRIGQHRTVFVHKLVCQGTRRGAHRRS